MIEIVDIDPWGAQVSIGKVESLQEAVAAMVGLRDPRAICCGYTFPACRGLEGHIASVHNAGLRVPAAEAAVHTPPIKPRPAPRVPVRERPVMRASFEIEPSPPLKEE